jgi:hypothetical protein
MLTRIRIGLAVAAAALLAAAGAQAYERELTPRHVREAYFLGRDTTFRLEEFLKAYVVTLPVPARGPHVQRIAVSTPFKEMVDRARRSPDGYNAVKAEDDYRQSPPRLTVEVTLLLTPTYPAHTPYGYPIVGPVTFRDENFWQDVQVHLLQQGKVEPLARAGRPLLSCDLYGGCWLTGAVVTFSFDPEQVASRPAKIVVAPPEGEPVVTEFDLSRLR